MRRPLGRRIESRWMRSARLRRLLVYALAGALVLIAGAISARLARPPDRYGEVRVEGLPGVSEGARIEGARQDPETGRTWLDVREGDGRLRHYVIGEDSGVSPAPPEEAPGGG